MKQQPYLTQAVNFNSNFNFFCHERFLILMFHSTIQNRIFLWLDAMHILRLLLI